MIPNKYVSLHFLSMSGLICRKQSASKTFTHGVYLRPRLGESSRTQSGLGVWQILPQDSLHLDVVKHGDYIRFRHVISGQYLCIRPPTEEDEDVIKHQSCIVKTKEHRDRKECKKQRDESDPDEELGDTRGEKNDLKEDGPAELFRYSVATTSRSDDSTLFRIMSLSSFSMIEKFNQGLKFYVTSLHNLLMSCPFINRTITMILIPRYLQNCWNVIAGVTRRSFVIQAQCVFYS